MDTPEKPNLGKLVLENDTPPDDIKERAREIAAIVERDRKRRNNAVYALFGLLTLTVALAGLVFTYGVSGQQAMDNAVQNKVTAASEKQVTTVIKRVEDRIPTVVETKLPDVVETKLPDALKAQLPDVVNKSVEYTVEDQFDRNVAPTLDTFATQIRALEDRGTTSQAQFTFTEVGKIKQTITDLPKFEGQMKAFAGRLDELATANAGRSWNEERSDVLDRLDTLEGDMKQKLVQLGELSTKLDAALQQMGPGKDPCSAAADFTAALFRTYTAKENTTSRFHDLEFKVKLKDVKDRTVRGLSVFRTEHVLLAERDVMMGDMVSFEDNNFRYNLIAIFVNKRLLINDFVGFAISKTRKCPTPAVK